jgi:hypothetical protein
VFSVNVDISFCVDLHLLLDRKSGKEEAGRSRRLVSKKNEEGRRKEGTQISDGEMLLCNCRILLLQDSQINSVGVLWPQQKVEC